MKEWYHELEQGDYIDFAAQDSMANKAIISIAISLKRIADEVCVREMAVKRILAEAHEAVNKPEKP